ncbi:MAG: glycosyltransferase family 2 protein [Planctomycetes bacterium]|nr:glycosyltransferase family 2 protein [Planctomycetota bacterium]
MTSSLTIVIPAFNASDTITEAIDSALKMPVPGIDVVVVDDGSTDDTFALASAVRDTRVRVVRTPNRGVGAARNTGLRLAESGHVCFLDADDALTPDFAQRTLASIGPMDFVLCGLAYCTPLLESTGWMHLPTLADCTRESLLRFNQLAVGGVVFRSGFLQELDRMHGGAFPEGTHAEDWEFFLRCAAAGARGAEAIPAALYRYRTRPETRSDGVEPLWAAGKELIGRWCADDATVRAWTVRMLARAALSGRLTLCRRMLGELGGLRPGEAATLAGSLRWSLRRARVSGRVSLHDHDPLDGSLQLLELVGVDQATREQVRSLAAVIDWGELALSIARRLASSEHLVLFGFGRNGQEAARMLDRHRIAFSVIDDRPGAAPGRRVLAISDLGSRDVVLVTPDERGDIMQRLAKSTARVLTPEALARTGTIAA